MEAPETHSEREMSHREEQSMIRKGTIIGVPLATVVAIIWAWNGWYENKQKEVVASARLEWIQDSTAMSARHRNEIQRLNDLHAENIRMHELEDRIDFLSHQLGDVNEEMTYGDGRMERITARTADELADLLRRYLEHVDESDERIDDLERGKPNVTN